MLDDLLNKSCDDKNIIFQQECENYTIKVCENDPYRWLTLGSDFIQALISLSEPENVIFPYARSMLLAVAFKQKPLRVLNLGYGCGTFERFIFKYFPHISITSVESDIDIINVSRKYFYIPSDYPVINKSADEFLKSNKTKYDIIFCDIHDGKTHPDCLSDSSFYINIMHCLNDDGVLVINLLPASEKELIDVLLAVRKVFSWQHLLNFDNYGNFLIYIHMQEPRTLHADDEICKEFSNRSNIDLTDVIDRLVLLPTKLKKY